MVTCDGAVEHCHRAVCGEQPTAIRGQCHISRNGGIGNRQRAKVYHSAGRISGVAGNRAALDRCRPCEDIDAAAVGLGRVEGDGAVSDVECVS